MPYKYTNQIRINDFSESNIGRYYDQGFLFTRLGRGVMNQVRSLRVNLKEFEPSSENKRVLKKTEALICLLRQLPYSSYHWSIGKMASDFYSTKFGEGTMSANKIKEMFTDPKQSNMNSVFVFRAHPPLTPPYEGVAEQRAFGKRPGTDSGGVVGYCLTYQTSRIIHYSYPFYNLQPTTYNLTGIAMMTKAILYAQEHDKTFIYLGSVYDKKSLYKLQFKGLEWWDNDHWNNNLVQLKTIASNA